MKTIGIKLADGSFYPVLEDNTPSEKELELTTAHNNQTKVMVDLYRSATCSMEDAEYVDSLQIENLVARPNGEADIKFNISLDENNQLSARIIDSETGNESNTTITLVSRTLEERLVTDEYGINDTQDDSKTGSALAGAVAAGGLLAAAAALRNKEEKEEAVEPVSEEPEVDFSEETVAENPEVEINEEPVADEPVFEETSVDEPVVEESTENFDPDASILTDDAFTTDADEEIAAPENSELPDMDFDLPDDTSTADETIIADDTVATDDTISVDDTITDDNTFSMDDDTFSTDETITSEASDTSDDTLIEEDSGLPDMDFDIPDDTSSDSTLADMDFDLPDDTTINETPEMPDDFFNTDGLDSTEDIMKAPTFDSESPASAGLNFDGLYDEETERGTPAQDDEDDVKKKTKVPVIICIVCAIICIIATALILFIIPSKYNLITKKNAKENLAVVVEEPAPQPEPAPAPEPEPAVPEAKEDEIVIIEKAEEVVPKQPPVAVEKPKDIVYKIKWGDTLWDIADTYYKNPWRYKYIARYNGIKNPDYIISGTKIVIPAE